MARPSTDWVLHFATGKPKLGERLFEESGRLHELQRKLKIAQYNRCWGHHPTKICSRAERCSRCGSIKHKATECKQLVPRCINCHGPHAATEPNCMARPTRAGRKTVQRTRDQLSVISEQGQKKECFDPRIGSKAVSHRGDCRKRIYKRISMLVWDHNPTELHIAATTIWFLCANLGRGDLVTDIILQSAWDSETDVLLIQKPWTQHKDGFWLTKLHLGLDRHLPPRVAANSSRPRSLIYTRKGIKCQQQAVCETSPDLTAVKVEGVTFVSVYCAPGVDLLGI
ncbi:Hypothetical protein BGHDH14_bgh04882 [Blumeria hordei DH14]|uniref:Uncharacterized protein n=1 Tax=Blumeria graminis f. sp. hordei (strain DH14) TaxID=546991 RepID=N1JC21_BLUG1|nr:Hypothetical protein BGHDH14_bgh04882 [Blumeria hordei DH14]